MTDTIEAPPPVAGDHRPARPRTAVVAFAGVAIVAVLPLLLAVIAITDRDGDHATMMGGASDPMMDGSHMPGMPGAMTGEHQRSSPTLPGARPIAVTATSFEFMPAEIHVRAGEAVTIALTADDITHDLTIDDLDLHVAAAPGRAGSGSFQAPAEPGRYVAYCSVAGHRAAGMTATVVVDPT